LRVQNGDTVVIGGLLKNSFSNSNTKLPILGDIPVLGAAFRHKDKTTTERELIIFLTPHVVVENQESKLAYNGSREIIREQDIPKARNIEVEKALSAFETQ
jgi:type II secretory pathway component GspD/PulD (secretin)